MNRDSRIEKYSRNNQVDGNSKYSPPRRNYTDRYLPPRKDHDDRLLENTFSPAWKNRSEKYSKKTSSPPRNHSGRFSKDISSPRRDNYTRSTKEDRSFSRRESLDRSRKEDFTEASFRKSNFVKNNRSRSRSNPRQFTRDLSQPRRIRKSDLSPPRRNDSPPRRTNKRSDRDSSPPRRIKPIDTMNRDSRIEKYSRNNQIDGNSKYSPPRRNHNGRYSPARKDNISKFSPPRRNYTDRFSPPRKDHNDRLPENPFSPPRRNRSYSKNTSSPPRNHFGRFSKDVSSPKRDNYTPSTKEDRSFSRRESLGRSRKENFTEASSRKSYFVKDNRSRSRSNLRQFSRDVSPPRKIRKFNLSPPRRNDLLPTERVNVRSDRSTARDTRHWSPSSKNTQINISPPRRSNYLKDNVITTSRNSSRRDHYSESHLNASPQRSHRRNEQFTSTEGRHVEKYSSKELLPRKDQRFSPQGSPFRQSDNRVRRSSSRLRKNKRDKSPRESQRTTKPHKPNASPSPPSRSVRYVESSPPRPQKSLKRRSPDGTSPPWRNKRSDKSDRRNIVDDKSPPWTDQPRSERLSDRGRKGGLSPARNRHSDDRPPPPPQKKHDESKSLARYADDEKLNILVKNKELLKDPMYEYFQKGKGKKGGIEGKVRKPMYKGLDTVSPESFRYSSKPSLEWN